MTASPLSTPSLSKVTRIFHWITGLLMIGLTTLGFYMVEMEDGDLYSIHKAIGVLALLILLPRAIYRIKQGFPTAVAKQSERMNKLAHYAHWGLLAGTLLMPVSGMFYSGFGGYGIKIFGYVLVERVMSDGKVQPVNETLYLIGKTLHTAVGYTLAALIIAHIAAALKHHVIDKDETLKRMIG